MSDEQQYTEENIVDLAISSIGNVVVKVNGDIVGENDDEDCKNQLIITIKKQGDVLFTVNGEDFQHE